MFFKILTLLALLTLPIFNFIDALYNFRWQPYHLHEPNVFKIWDPQPPGTLRACPGL